MKYVHPTAMLDPYITFDENVFIWGHAIVRRGTVIEKNCVIGSACYIGTDCVIGEGTHIQHGCFIPNNTVIGKRVFIGPNVTMTDDRHPRAGNNAYRAEPPVIKDDVSIGAGAVLLPGITLHEGCVVGAGATVSRSVPQNVTVVGDSAETLVSAKRWQVIKDKIIRAFVAAAVEWEA